MSTTITRARHGLTAMLSATLIAGALGLGSSEPAQADADDAATPTLSWPVSQQVTDHLSAQTVGDGATITNSVANFPQGVSKHDFSTGVTSTDYEGSFTAGFGFGGTTLYSVTIAEPTVEVDAAGSGRITADVSSDVAEAYRASNGDPTPPTRVTVTTFGGAQVSNSAVARTLEATPDWVGVLPAGSPAANELQLATGRPTNGESFSPEFLGAIAKGIRAHFHRSADAEQPKKKAAQFQATLPAPAVEASLAGDVVTTQGWGFSAKVNPGDDGVYVGIAEGDELPDVSDPSNQASFLAADWVTPTRIDKTTGSFTSALTVDPAKVDPTKTYSVFTWQAHSHSNTSQDTVTPIDLSSLAVRSTTTKLTTKGSTYGKRGSLTVSVAGATTGTVKVSGGGWTKTLALKNGKATNATPINWTPGTRTLTASYTGSTTHAKSTGKATHKVTKGKPSVKRVGKVKRPTRKKSGWTKVRIGSSGPAKATGHVRAVLVRGKKTYLGPRVKLNSRGEVNKLGIRKAPKGKYRLEIRYSGNGNLTKATGAKGSITIK